MKLNYEMTSHVWQQVSGYISRLQVGLDLFAGLVLGRDSGSAGLELGGPYGNNPEKKVDSLKYLSLNMMNNNPH